MHKAAKVGMLVWTILCFFGACSGMMNVAKQTGDHPSDAAVVGTGIGLLFWMLFWFCPVAGMGIIALVTKPEINANTHTSVTPAATLCAHCGQYYAGHSELLSDGFTSDGRFCMACGADLHSYPSTDSTRKCEP